MPSSHSYSSIIVCIVLAWITCAAVSSAGVAPQIVCYRPTPANSVQWQPETDRSDTRLATSIATWHAEVALDELLAEMSATSGVLLRSVPEMGSVELSAFMTGANLDGAMCALAEVLEAYWAFARGSASDARVYWLTPFDPIQGPFGKWYEEHHAALRRARASSSRAEREARLELYASAIVLSPTELMQQYEETDPWLCADLLHPATRPMIEQVCSLAPGQREKLLSEGQIQFSVAHFDAEFGRHLATWAKGRWGRPATAELAPDPDRMTRFAAPEERWEHATIHLWWSSSALKLLLNVPDVARFDADAIRTSQRSPYLPRKQLAELGFRDDTEEYAEAVRAEALEWQASHGDGVPERLSRRMPYADATPHPNRTDCRLREPVRLSPTLPGGVSVPELLEAIARQCGLHVVATYLPPGDALVHIEGNCPVETTLGAALEDLRTRRGGMFTWNFRGNYLVARDLDYRVLQASRLPPSTRARWEGSLSSGPIAIDELASLLGELNEVQVQAIVDEFPVLRDVPLYGIQAYGTLRNDQRSRLTPPADGLPFSDLSDAQAESVGRFARQTHPWLTSSDLSHAVLRGIPRKLSTGEDAFSFIIEYHFPDAPNDRDILFTSPFSITITGSSATLTD